MKAILTIAIFAFIVSVTAQEIPIIDSCGNELDIDWLSITFGDIGTSTTTRILQYVDMRNEYVAYFLVENDTIGQFWFTNESDTFSIDIIKTPTGWYEVKK